MTRRATWMILPGLGVLAAALGLGRLRFDTDVLALLPPEMPEVKGLMTYHQAFAREDELVILLEDKTGGDTPMEEHAASLARALESAGVAKHANWQPQWRDEGRGMAELVAYLWINGPHEIAAAQVNALSPENRRRTLDNALADVATAMEGADLVMRAHDPMGFLKHPSLEWLLDSAGGGTGGFESPDGRLHLVLAEAPRPVHGYKEAGEWLKGVRQTIDAWRKSAGRGIRVELTGEPAFSSEIGGAMERDLRGTVGITSLLIGLLFWAMQRRLALLAGLAGVLGLVFLTTLGLAGWIYQDLSMIAAGFAAILIGLAVDYGVLICQEAKHVQGCGNLRRATTASIFWAAATTAVVFLALNRSGLPGIAQLGTMVACGIVAGAVLMLGYYLPFVSRVGAGRAGGTGRVPLPSRRVSLGISIALLLAAAATLFCKGPPGVSFDPRIMRPRQSEALATFEKLKAAFPQWNADGLKLVVEAPDDATMLARIGEARRRAEGNPKIEASRIPEGWWPDTARQAANGNLLRSMAEAREGLLDAGEQAGFTAEGMAFDQAVLTEILRLSSESGTVFPSSQAATGILRGFVSRRGEGGGVLVGELRCKPESATSLAGEGIWPAGWDLLRPVVAPLVRRDLLEVFLPMAGLMLVMLAAMFRSAREVACCFASMSLGGLMLLAMMRWLGIEWNFLNIAATPLLLGTGIDYGIHVGLALRRNGGNVGGMWHGTGKAVLFCGMSTAIGFGSLCFASNDAMRGLGAVAVIGILSSMMVSVFLLPGFLVSGHSE